MAGSDLEWVKKTWEFGKETYAKAKAVAPTVSLKGRFNTLARDTGCALGAKCPIQKMLKLRSEFQFEIAFANDPNPKTKGLDGNLYPDSEPRIPHLQTMKEAAHFTKQVVEQWVLGAVKELEKDKKAFTSKDIEERGKTKKDIWKHVRGKQGRGEATSYEDSYLKEDIERIDKKLKYYQKLVDDSCKGLCEYVQSPEFLDHLHDEHGVRILDRETVGVCYPEDLARYDKMIALACQEDPNKTDKPFLREVDHYLAVAIESLAASWEGRNFLEKWLGDKNFNSRKGFGTAWQYFRRLKNLTGPLGKLFLNVTQGLPSTAWAQINEAKSLLKFREQLKAGVFTDRLELLGEYTGRDIKGILMNQAKNYSESSLLDDISGKIKAKTGKEMSLELLVGFGGIDEAEKAALAKAQLDNAWVGLAIASVALALSGYDAYASQKKGYKKDPFGFARSQLTLLRDSLRLTREIMATVEKDYLSKSMFQPAGALQTGNRMAGIAAGYFGAFVSFMNAEEAARNGQNFQAFLNVLGGVGGIAEPLLGFVGLSTAATVVGVAVLVIAVLIEYFKDPPFLVWLELTPWGTSYELHPQRYVDQMSYSEVIDQFFKRLFTLEVRVVDGIIKVLSTGLSDDSHLRVSVRPKAGKPVEKAVSPGETSVEGKGSIKKDPHWNWKGKPNQINIHRAWEIWNDIKRDDKTECEVVAKMDPDEDGAYELEAKTTGTFPRPYIIVAADGVSGEESYWFRKHGHGGHVKLEQGNVLTIVVKTFAALGYTLFVELEGEGLKRANPWTSRQVSEGDLEGQGPVADTEVRFVLPVYPEEYTLTARAALGPPGYLGDEPDLEWKRQSVEILTNKPH